MSYLGISLIRLVHQEFFWFMHTILIERMSLVITYLGFHHVFVRCHIGGISLIFWDHLEVVGLCM